MSTYLSKQIADTTSMIRRWHGHRARMLELTRSHSTLSVLVGDEEYGKNLLISCLEPVYLHGPTCWEASELRLVPTMLETGDRGIALLDEAHDVRILACAFEVAENVKW